jgi:DNA-binding MarR family transcriptional regulator
MVEQELISEVVTRRTAEDDARRRYYRITTFGDAVARAEMKRMSDLVNQARRRGLAPGTT